MAEPDLPLVRTKEDAQNEYIAKNVLVFFVYAACAYFSSTFVPTPSTLYPALGVGVGMLFLLGLDLWPGIFLAAITVSLLRGSTPIALLLGPLAQALQSFAGAYILRKGNVDPLFRHSRDILWLFGMVAVVSLIIPTVAISVVYLNHTLLDTPIPAVSWGARYTATLFCLLILTPFLLRWFAKPRFNRNLREIIELVVVFAVLIAISWLIFVTGVGAIGSISLAYLLLIPLFWIALRMRPRFITLALMILSGIAIFGLFYIYGVDNPVFTHRLFAIESFLIVIAAMFLLITSLEEDRRLSANLLKSQIGTLENALSRISSESSAKNDFIAVLAHELRNPLAPIATSIEYMKLNQERDEREMDMLKIMEDRMGVIKRLLDDLLDSSRITEGKIALTKEIIDLELILRRAVLSTEHAFHERHQTLFVSYPKQAIRVEGDPVRLEQVFTNLLTNASKYSPSGERVEVILSATEDSAIVKVKDKGIGIEEGALEHIFKPFYQTGKTSATKKGLGIGLALVRGFVTMHGGTIEASSAGPGKGSVFMVTLPRTDKPVVAPQQSPVVSAARSSSGLRILVVDDNDAAAGGIGRLLRLKGFTVDFAYDGQQALEKSEDFIPDIILLDISLPDQDGYTVAKILRTKGYTGRIIGLTGFSTEDAKVKGELAGFDAYLVKPAGLTELARVIPEIS